MCSAALKHRLDSARYQQLDRCEWWTWDGYVIHPPPRSWEESWNRVKNFIDDNGRRPNKLAIKREERRPGTWVDTQRTAKDTMPTTHPARHQQLENCGWWKWTARGVG